MKRRIKIINKEERSVKKGVTKYLLFAVGGLLALSSVFMTVETATSGVEVSNLREKERILSMEKRNLEATLVHSLSVNDLGEKSTEMGFVKPVTMVYVAESLEVAAKLP